MGGKKEKHTNSRKQTCLPNKLLLLLMPPPKIFTSCTATTAICACPSAGTVLAAAITSATYANAPPARAHALDTTTFQMMRTTTTTPRKLASSASRNHAGHPQQHGWSLQQGGNYGQPPQMRLQGPRQYRRGDWAVDGRTWRRLQSQCTEPLRVLVLQAHHFLVPEGRQTSLNAQAGSL